MASVNGSQYGLFHGWPPRHRDEKLTPIAGAGVRVGTEAQRATIDQIPGATCRT